MRAVYYEQFGDAGVLHIGDQPIPEPGDGEVLIRVRAASVNPVDWKIREGFLKDFFPHVFPIIPGWDVAGDIAALGAGVNGFAVGDPVYAYARKPVVQAGTYADYVTVAADVAAPIPANMDYVQASTIPLAGLTVWQSLFEFAGIKAGDNVLVPAAAGGVGSLAVQLAAHAGATVYGTASSGNADYVRGLGAARVIDYRTEDVADVVRAEVPEGFDIVFDTVGGETLAASYDLVKTGGALPTLNDPADETACAARNIRALRVFSEPNGVHLRQLTGLIEAGALKPAQIETYPLGEAAAAMNASQTGHTRGKIVLGPET